MHLVPMNDPRENRVLDMYPTLSERERAKGRMLCERAACIDSLPEADQENVLRGMDHPSWWELQAEETRLVERIADDAARQIYDRPMDQLPMDVRATLRCHAAIFLRSQWKPWRNHGLEGMAQAIHTQLEHELGKALPPAAVHGLRGLAVRCAGIAAARYTLEMSSLQGMAPGIYLQLAGDSLTEKAGTEK